MRPLLVVIACLLLAACTTKKDAAQKPTERQVDSVIGNSNLPGAQGVKGAMRVADSAAARNARLDSAGGMFGGPGWRP
jgi:outer membrane biogenesis lipoprotein LolB